jgi:hypothetical protein
VGLGIHSDAAHAAHVGEGQDVSNRVGVVPDFAEIREVADLSGILETTIGNGAQNAAAVADVGEHGWVAKNGDRALRVEQDPVGVNRVVVLCHDEGMLKECRARRGRGRGEACRAVLGIVSERLTLVATNVRVKTPVRAGSRCSGGLLGEGSCDGSGSIVASRSSGDSGRDTPDCVGRGLVIVQEALCLGQVGRVLVPAQEVLIGEVS